MLLLTEPRTNRDISFPPEPSHDEWGELVARSGTGTRPLRDDLSNWRYFRNPLCGDTFKVSADGRHGFRRHGFVWQPDACRLGLFVSKGGLLQNQMYVEFLPDPDDR